MEEKTKEKEGRRWRSTPCTYVSVNDEDYRSFLAAGEKLKASRPGSLFSLPRPTARTSIHPWIARANRRYVDSLFPLDTRRYRRTRTYAQSEKELPRRIHTTGYNANTGRAVLYVHEYAGAV